MNRLDSTNLTYPKPLPLCSTTNISIVQTLPDEEYTTVYPAITKEIEAYNNSTLVPPGAEYQQYLGIPASETMETAVQRMDNHGWHRAYLKLRRASAIM